jgi:prepilin-type N-terminal cleavage/methylation domain-containing protein
MRPPRGLAHRVKSAGGYTLSEMIVVLAILGFVLSALLAVFVSGTRAETDMNKRFQAQQQSRLALTRLRREIHCAYGAQTNAAAVTDAATVDASVLTLSFGPYCTNPPAASNYQVMYCAVSLGLQRYGLYRQVGTTCSSSGTLVADYLTSSSLFGYLAPSGSIPRITISLPVDIDPSNPAGTYQLLDAITLRNSARTP